MNEPEGTELFQAMDLVIPPDTSPGAGQSAVFAELARIVAAQNQPDGYWERAKRITKSDLEDKDNAFAQQFKCYVLDAYYSVPDSGAWQDMGFRL